MASFAKFSLHTYDTIAKYTCQDALQRKLVKKRNGTQAVPYFLNLDLHHDLADRGSFTGSHAGLVDILGEEDGVFAGLQL